MNGRRVVAGGTLLAVGTLAAVLAAPVLLGGDLASLPIMIFGLATAVFGATQLRGGLHAPSPRRMARRLSDPIPERAETNSPPTPYHSTSDYPYTSSRRGRDEGGHGSDGDQRGEGYGGDSGGRSGGGSGGGSGGRSGGDSGGGSGGGWSGGGDSGGGWSGGGGGDSGGGGGS
ncbi:hypothetical protein [Micromonospora sp. NPDC005189]|uniref:hypothetical protein n=1 Tax=unclassified Micromonospora TaxID=2617518 RepID=UPI0033A13F04